MPEKARISSRPKLTSKPVRIGPKGMGINRGSTGTKDIMGASQNRSLSDPYGLDGCLPKSFSASVMVCKIPWGPTSNGPGLLWICPATLRSKYTNSMALTATKTATATTAIMIRTNGNSSKGMLVSLNPIRRFPQYDFPNLPQYHFPKLRGRLGRRRLPQIINHVSSNHLTKA